MSITNEPYLQRKCPTCGEGQLDSGWCMSSRPPAEDCTPSELQSSWRGFFKDQKHFFTYCRCKGCGQIYSPRYFTPTQLTELYRQMEDNTGGLPETLMAKTQRGYFEQLRKKADFKKGGYLELGPDIGLFTGEVMKHVTFSPYWMVEPNAAVHPALDRLLGERPHVLLNDSEEIEKIPDASLALVVAIHVLDHLLEPQQLLEKLMPKMLSGGWILAVTHNRESFVARAFGHRWPPYCLQHPQIYSPTTLKNSFAQVGLQDVQVAGTVNYFPVMYLLRHFFFAAGLGRLPLPQWSSWTVGLKLGNIAAMGRKA